MHRFPTLAPSKILVIGMSGLIGSLVGKALAQRYEVRALNRRPVEGVECILPGCGGFRRHPSSIRGSRYRNSSPHACEDDDLEQHLRTNILGAYKVYEASRVAGVRRVVLGSSRATQYFYETEEPIKAMVESRWTDVPEPRPSSTVFLPCGPRGYTALRRSGRRRLGATTRMLSESPCYAFGSGEWCRTMLREMLGTPRFIAAIVTSFRWSGCVWKRRSVSGTKLSTQSPTIAAGFGMFNTQNK